MPLHLKVSRRTGALAAKLTTALLLPRGPSPSEAEAEEEEASKGTPSTSRSMPPCLLLRDWPSADEDSESVPSVLLPAPVDMVNGAGACDCFLTGL